LLKAYLILRKIYVILRITADEEIGAVMGFCGNEAKRNRTADGRG
jgi:hypothetical protein